MSDNYSVAADWQDDCFEKIADLFWAGEELPPEIWDEFVPLREWGTSL
jgi:hypothetical protein